MNRFPEGSQVGIYDREGKLQKAVDIAPDGKLAEPIAGGSLLYVLIPDAVSLTALPNTDSTINRLTPY